MAKATLKTVRLSFPNLFKAVAFEEGGDKKYDATFLIEKGSDNDKRVQKAIKEAAVAKWGAKADAILKSIQGNNNKYAYKDGDLKEYDGYEGMMSIKAKTKERPILVDQARRPIAEEDGVFYAGCYVTAVIDVFAYDTKMGKGISAGLTGVQFVKDGDAFGAARPEAEDLFEDLSEGAEAEDFV